MFDYIKLTLQDYDGNVTKRLNLRYKSMTIGYIYIALFNILTPQNGSFMGRLGRLIYSRNKKFAAPPLVAVRFQKGVSGEFVISNIT